MKTVIFILLLSGGMFGQTEPQKFRAVVKITYYSITLQEAARIEKAIRKEFENDTTNIINIQLESVQKFSNPYNLITVPYQYYNDDGLFHTYKKPD